jgi:hypothetical protein
MPALRSTMIRDGPVTYQDIAELRQEIANLEAALNTIARGMGDLVTIYESLHVRTTGEEIDYAGERDGDD